MTDSHDQSGCGCSDPSCSMPQVTFSTFILSLASSALVQLGEVPNPETGAFEKNLLVAKHTIDILEMLESKTRACLDADVSVSAVPGANAALMALALSGLPTDRFFFAGFLPPRSAARRQTLESWRDLRASLIFY